VPGGAPVAHRPVLPQSVLVCQLAPVAERHVSGAVQAVQITKLKRVKFAAAQQCQQRPTVRVSVENRQAAGGLKMRHHPAGQHGGIQAVVLALRVDSF